MNKKLISVVLLFSIILSLFSVYSFASGVSETKSGDNYVKQHIHYKNTFGDAVDDTASAINLNNATNSYYSIKSEANANKYGSFYLNDNKTVNPDVSNNNVYFQISPNSAYSPSPDKLGYLIFEMDINDFGKSIKTKSFVEAHSGEGTIGVTRFAAGDIINIGNDILGNYIYFAGSTSKKAYIPSNEWVHVRLEFSILSSDTTTYNIKCIVGEKSFSADYKLGVPATVAFLRIGCTNSDNITLGLDNIVLYSTPELIESPDEIGTINDALLMKVGAENAKMNGVQIELTNTPIAVDGEAFCPVYILEEYTGTTCPAQLVQSFDGVEYIHIDNVTQAFGVSIRLHEMGLIIIGEENDIEPYDDGDYVALTELMKTFVFNIPTADAFIEDVKEHTNNFTHPYILANSDRFDELRAIYKAGQAGTLTSAEDKQLYDYITKYLASASSQFNSYCGVTPDKTYTGILSSKIPVNTNYSKYNNNGHDNGGRLTVPTGPLYHFAFAYQMTGNLNYARAAYDFSLALGEWNHWGASHFLNCADAAAPFSISYDWLYNAYKELEAKGEKSKFDGEVYRTEKLAEIIFTHAIIPGYIQSNGINCPWPGSVESRYATTTNNWNAVCTSGMVASALAILHEDISTEGMQFVTQKKGTFEEVIVSISEIGNTAIHVGLNTYSDYAAKLATMNMNSLMRYGLFEYAPDGSYVESPGYWAYGTNTYFRMVASLMSATGDDYGFMDSWGIDTTCYFAIHSESSDYKQFNFNDGSVGTQDSSYFFFVGNFYGDDNLIRVRKKHLASGKSYSLFDIIFYDTTVTGDPELSTEYYMRGIDGYTVRSSWDKGALYAGIMGGTNKVSHAHMDAGTFVYHNKGKIWFHDLGSDNYNIRYTNEKGQSMGYFSNYELYRIGAEGHNIITITSEQDTLPYGQDVQANPPITRHYADGDNGGYAIIDMSDAYGDHVIDAKRGMLFTDSRSTVVIQDEIVFNGKKTAYWFGHYNVANGYVDDVIISSDGRTAFMISGDEMIRVSIVSDNSDLKFEIMDCYTYLLDITHRTDRDNMGAPATENSRDSFYKLAIKCENVSELNLAVVIESVNGYVLGTDYEWTDMDSWTVDAQDSPKIEYNFKADYEDYGLHIGNESFVSGGKLYNLNRFSSSTNSYLGVHSVDSGTLSSDEKLEFNFKNTNPIVTLNAKYFAVEFDLLTDTHFPKGTLLALYAKSADGTGSYTSVATLSDTGITVNGVNISLSDDWAHVSIIFDNASNLMYFYFDGVLVTKFESPAIRDAYSITSLAFIMPGETVSDGFSSILIDNVSARKFGNLYDGNLDAVLSSGASLSGWTDNIANHEAKVPLATSGSSILYTVRDIEAAIQNGYDVTLIRDCDSRVNVSGAATVNTNGFKFKFLSSTHIADVSGDVITFKKGSIRVIWHLPTGTIAESYSSSSMATFKKTNVYDLGEVTEKRIEYANGYVGFEYYTTGWAAINGGKYLEDDEMIVTTQNREFWLVDNKPLECLYVVETYSGDLVPHYYESELRTELTANTSARKVVLCNDVRLLNTAIITLAAGGKHFYLNGHTIYNNTYDVHLFYFRETATADYNFYGPGTIDVTDPRTVFTSGASANKNNYGVVMKGINLYTNTQLCDLRIGQHRFIDCNFYQHPSIKNSFVDLWDRNGVVTNGVSSNLVTVRFENCEIYREKGSGYSIFSYTGSTYSEIYLVDTTVVTDGTLMSSERLDVKLHISGNSMISAGYIVKGDKVMSNLMLENGVSTNLALPSVNMPTGATLIRDYATSLPYKVSTSYATVKWLDLNGSVIAKEVVSVGDEAAAHAIEALKYLKSINTGTTQYEYASFTVAQATSYSVYPTVSKLGVLESMSMDGGFALEILIPKSIYETQMKSLEVNGVLIGRLSFDRVTRNGEEYYRYRITQISPLDAYKSQNIILTLNNSEVKETSISVIDYLRKLLSVTDVQEEHILGVKILKYISSIYVYNGLEATTEYKMIKELIDENRSYDVLYGESGDVYTSTAPIKNAIRSVSLNMTASLKMRFYINPEFTGKITVNYLGNSKEIVVKNGKYNSSDYFEIELTVSEIDKEITLSTGEKSIVYSVGAYKTMLNTTDPKLAGVLRALLEYGAAAKEYHYN